MENEGNPNPVLGDQGHTALVEVGGGGLLRHRLGAPSSRNPKPEAVAFPRSLSGLGALQVLTRKPP